MDSLFISGTGAAQGAASAKARKGLFSSIRLAVIAVVLLCPAQWAQAVDWSGSVTLTNQQINEDVVLTGNTTVTVNGFCHINGVISGPYTLTFTGGTGSPDLRLTKNNTYSGGTVISGMSVVLGGMADFPNEGPAGSIVGNVLLENSTAELAFNRSNQYIYSGVISGTGNVAKWGSGDVWLTGVNTYTGATQIYQGILVVGSTSANSAAHGSINGTSKVQIRGATGELAFRTSGPGITFAKPIIDMFPEEATRGALSFEAYSAGAGQLTLTADNTFSGTFYNHAGRVNFGDGGETGNVAASSIVNIGELRIHRSNSCTIGGVISGSGSLYVEGTGKTILTGVNTYTGGTQIGTPDDAGFLQLGNGAVTGSIASTAHVNMDGGSTFRIEPTAHLSFEKPISGDGKVEYKGIRNESFTPELTLTGANTYTGATTIEAGGLFFGNGGSTGMPAGNIHIASNSWVMFIHNTDQTYAGVISGGGTVAKNGANKLTLSGNHTYTGNTDIYDGELVLTGTIEHSSRVQFYFETNDATLTLGGNKTIKRLNGEGANSIVNLNTHTLTIGTTGGEDGDGNFPGKIIGIGSLVKRGIGTLVGEGPDRTTLQLTDCNYNGATTVEEGQLNIGGGIEGNIVTNGIVAFAQPGKYAYNGVISGSGHVVNLITGDTLTLNGVNTYTGETRIWRGTLKLGAGGSIAASSMVKVGSSSSNPAVLNIEAGNKSVKALNSTAGSAVALGANTLTIGTSGQTDGSGDLAGVFTGTGSVNKHGTDTLILRSASTATGKLSILAGTMETTDGAAWNGEFSQSPNTTLNVAGILQTGALQLNGGAIGMNITGATPSLIEASGALTLSSTRATTLNITTTAVTNYTLIEAASGVDESRFEANLTAGYEAELFNSNGQLLQLTATAVAKAVTVGTQEGTLKAGTAGEVTFALVTASIADGSYTATVSNLPTGVTVKGEIEIAGSTGTLTLAGDETTLKGDYTLTLIIDGATSNEFTLTIGDGVGIDHRTLTGITVYGTVNGICIDNRSGIVLKSVQIVDMTGRVVYDGNATGTITIPVNGGGGIYVVQMISDDNRTLTAKVRLDN